MIKFGTAGNSESFYAEGNKNTFQIFEWLSKRGLDAYEYSAGRGVKMREETAVKIGDYAKEYGISVSIHAPYYINLATVEDEKKEKNIGYLISSAKTLKLMGGKRIVFHPGSYGKIGKERAFANIKEALSDIIKIFKNSGFHDMILCTETMGKKNQSGDLDEIIELCSLDDMVYPTIDFGHLHARGLGAIKSIDDYSEILDKLKKGVSKSKYQNFHSHFSKIQYTAGGEKMHRTFDDEGFGPDFEPLAALIKKRGLTPTFICESKGTMAEDAMKMKEIYYNV